jgi:hypothetical protein
MIILKLVTNTASFPMSLIDSVNIVLFIYFVEGGVPAISSTSVLV